MPSKPTVMKSTVRMNWDSDPKMTFRLLKLVESNNLYRQALFPQDIGRIGRSYVVAAELCMEFLKDNIWMQDAERRGMVVRDEFGKWKRVKEIWTSHESNPVTVRIRALITRIKENFYKKEFRIDPKWSTWEDIQSPVNAKAFKKAHPYYFLLRQLVNPEVAPPVVLPPPPTEVATSSRQPPRRRRRSSTSSESSSSSGSSSSSPGPTIPKRPRQSVASASGDNADTNQSSVIKDEGMQRRYLSAQEVVADSSWRASGMLSQSDTDGTSDSDSDDSTDSDSLGSSESKGDIEFDPCDHLQPANPSTTRVDGRWPGPEREEHVRPLQSHLDSEAQEASPRITLVTGNTVASIPRLQIGPGRTVEDAIEVDDESSDVESVKAEEGLDTKDIALYPSAPASTRDAKANGTSRPSVVYKSEADNHARIERLGEGEEAHKKIQPIGCDLATDGMREECLVAEMNENPARRQQMSSTVNSDSIKRSAIDELNFNSCSATVLDWAGLREMTTKSIYKAAVDADQLAGLEVFRRGSSASSRESALLRGRWEMHMEFLNRLTKTSPKPQGIIRTRRLVFGSLFGTTAVLKGVITLARQIGFTVTHSREQIPEITNGRMKTITLVPKYRPKKCDKTFDKDRSLWDANRFFEEMMDAYRFGLVRMFKAVGTEVRNRVKAHNIPSSPVRIYIDPENILVDRTKRYIREMVRRMRWTHCLSVEELANGSPDTFRLHVTFDAIRGINEPLPSPTRVPVTTITPAEFPDWVRRYLGDTEDQGR